MNRGYVKIASEHTHPTCIKEIKIDSLIEDVATIKTMMGYKDQYNGTFRAQVEARDQSMEEQIDLIQEMVTRIDERQNAQQKILMIFFTVMIGALALIYVI